jgi:hypothetical protein
MHPHADERSGEERDSSDPVDVLEAATIPTKAADWATV